MANGTVVVGGQTYSWATSSKSVTGANSKTKKGLRDAEASFFQKAVDYMTGEDSPKSKQADPAIGRCDKQPGTGHLAWQIGNASYGDLKFDTPATTRLRGATAANMKDVLIELFIISTEQGKDLTIT
jgi:hypothetical protein